MRPIRIPPYVLPGMPRLTIGGENGTMPAEYVVEPDDDHGRKFSVLIELDDDDVNKVDQYRKIWLTLYGQEVPWRMGFAGTDGAPKLACRELLEEIVTQLEHAADGPASELPDAVAGILDQVRAQR